MLLLSFLLSVLWLSCLRGVRSCGGHRGLGSRFWACFGCLCLLFFLVRIKPHPIVVLGRTQFRSQVEFCGLCSSLTCTPSALVRDSRAMIEPYILGWLTSSCLSTAMLPLLGVRSCGGHRGLVSRYWSCFGCPFLFFSLMVVLDRTHFRSQVEFCGLCSSITFGSSPRLSGYDRALHPRIVDIFVVEHCYAAVAWRSKLRWPPWSRFSFFGLLWLAFFFSCCSN